MLVILQMYKIGLTGGIASGKSTVADMLDKQNLIVIDTDKIAWQLAEPHGSLWEAYRGRYGDRVINADNTLNRQAVAPIAFSDKGEKAWMDGMAHPLIWAEVAKRLQRLEEHGLNVAFVDVPLLFEAGWDKFMDESWVVAVSPEVQLQRLMDRNGFDEAEARRRIKVQMPIAEKADKADYVIYNDGALADLKDSLQKQLLALQERLQKLAGTAEDRAIDKAMNLF